MSWSVTDCFIFLFLFIYTCNGNPLGDRPRSEEAEPTQFIPAQWAKDSQIAYQWPQGEVPYYFDTKSYDDGIKGRVLTAMASLERDSCIRFKEQYQVPANNSGPWIHFTNPNTVRHCFHDCSYRANGEVKVVLGYDCLKQQDITHALLHGIGFRDEVAHPQRDLYIKVMWSNIQPAYRSMFRLQPVDSLAVVEYDPQSIMQFHERAFSLNGQATITPLLPGLKIQPSEDLSHLDKVKLRIMFGHECNKRKVHEVLDTCQDILSEVNKDVKSSENKKDDTNGIEKDKGSEEMILGGDVPSAELGNKKNSNPSENNETGGGNEKGTSPSEEMIDVGDDVGKDSGNKNSGSSSEMIVVGDDVEKGSGNENNKKLSEEMIVVGDDNAKGSGNENNKNPAEELIIVGDDNAKGSGDDNAKGSGDENNKNPSEEMIIVSDDNAKGSGNENNKNPSEEMIVVGDDNVKGSGDENNKNPSEEMIVVGDNNAKGTGDENNKNPSEEMIVVGDNNAKGTDDENNKNPSEEMIVVGDGVRKGTGNENDKNPSEEMIVVGDGDGIGKGNGNKKNKNPSEEMIDVGDNKAQGSSNENNNNPSQEIIVVGDGNTNKNNNEYHGGGNFHGGAFSPLKAGREKSKFVVVGKGDNNKNSIRSDNNRNTIDDKKELFIFGNRSTTSSVAAKVIAKSGKVDDSLNVVR